MKSLSKAAALPIAGVYPQTMQSFPIGRAMNKNLTVQMGNCNHRKYIPMLPDLIQQLTLDPTKPLSHVEQKSHALAAYKAFDERQSGGLKVGPVPGL
ncbi:hypothetical protein [Deinococcus peraridilitoris]|uniref:hypothetical protein n=1 Tax=Deinococcus peraridilitoris TaxID=432329 RepID=UPI0002F082D3|nr:hypothetical protein [Deinococcus peraridilitoris]